MSDLDARLRTVLGEAARAFAGTSAAPSIEKLQRRIDSPLRVAVAGRVKAGKSTLLNALVGERLAPTDAGECTKLVTTYAFSPGYDVTAKMLDGSVREIPFRRNEGHLEVEASLLPQVESLSVGWPSARLRQITLVDTPGIASLDAAVSERTEESLLREDGADAAIYLLRHVHRTDLTFLETFASARAEASTPISAVAVVSRADEIGAGRLDALDSARAIATRYQADARLRTVVSAVVPVAGLLAETATTLEEREATALRQCATSDASDLRQMLLSVDQFRQPELGPLTVELRERLLQRFGLFGLRLAIESWRTGGWQSGTELSRLLLLESGLPALERVVGERFAGRSRNLVARSVLSRLQKLLEVAPATSQSAATALLRELEAVESSAHEFAEMHMLDLVLSGEAEFDEALCAEAELATFPGPAPLRLGLAADSNSDALRDAAVMGVQRWRERAAEPLGSRASVYCAETLARTYEGLYAAVG